MGPNLAGMIRSGLIVRVKGKLTCLLHEVFKSLHATDPRFGLGIADLTEVNERDRQPSDRRDNAAFLRCSNSNAPSRTL